MIFLILPIHLFDKKYLNKSYNYIIWEHPHYFKGYRYNKKKILLHRASCKYYYDYLKKAGFECSYVEFTSKPKLKNYQIWDTVDKIKLPGNPQIIKTPNFILSLKDYAEYRKKTKKFFFNSFYMWGKKIKNILPEQKSTDKQNRNKLPQIKIPPVVKLLPRDKKYIAEASSYVNKNFPNNYGNTDNFIFPISHGSANKFLREFIKNKLANFGKYQDAIREENNTLFHSLLSTSLNIGLLNPSEIIPIILKKKTPMNNKEGFIRQLYWREYQRYCYIYFSFDGNYFGNNKKLTTKWYNGTTGILPLDNCIKNAWQTAYLHHIERLMIVGNLMNLSGISPKEGFKWFMEFSCDSYEWVMHQNVLEMVFFVSGGGTMRRPYISSSNYILKMSNYKKGEWCAVWDKLYYDFITNQGKKMHPYRYYYRSIKK